MSSIERTDESRADLWFADQTWGSYARTEQVDKTFDLFDRVDRLPQGATVLNLGSGWFLGVNAAMQLRRPDLNIIGVDSGYRLLSISDEAHALDEGVRELYETMSESDRTALEADQRWRTNLVAGVVEQIPLATGSVDLLFAHAVIPENTEPHERAFMWAFEEMSRVLKPGAQALLAPHWDTPDSVWGRTVAAAVEGGLFDSGEVSENPIYIPEIGHTLDAYMTTFVR